MISVFLYYLKLNQNHHKQRTNLTHHSQSKDLYIE
nr:MAG TPA: hypothetical protein [Caudoviricetes sp.]